MASRCAPTRRKKAQRQAGCSRASSRARRCAPPPCRAWRGWGGGGGEGGGRGGGEQPSRAGRLRGRGEETRDCCSGAGVGRARDESRDEGAGGGGAGRAQEGKGLGSGRGREKAGGRCECDS